MVMRVTCMEIKQRFANLRQMKIFCLACVSKDFTKHEQSEIFLNGTYMNFQFIIGQLKKKIYLIFTNI